MSNAYSLENHSNLKIDSGMGNVLLGQLELEAGSYLVWAKFSIGVNVQSGYPPPPWPNAVGMASLALGDADDFAYFGVKPESAENNTTINLMCAATIDRMRRARLYVINLYPLPIYCSSIKINVLKVDELSKKVIGEESREAPEDKEEKLRSMVDNARLKADKAFFSDLFKE